MKPQGRISTRVAFTRLLWRYVVSHYLGLLPRGLPATRAVRTFIAGRGRKPGTALLRRLGRGGLPLQEFCAAADSEFGENAGEVALYGPLGHAEPCRDVGIRPAAGDQPEDFRFPRRQRRIMTASRPDARGEAGFPCPRGHSALTRREPPPVRGVLKKQLSLPGCFLGQERVPGGQCFVADRDEFRRVGSGKGMGK